MKMENIFDNLREIEKGYIFDKNLDIDHTTIIKEFVDGLYEATSKIGQECEKDMVIRGLMRELLFECSLIQSYINARDFTGISRSMRVAMEIYSWVFFILNPSNKETLAIFKSKKMARRSSMKSRLEEGVNERSICNYEYIKLLHEKLIEAYKIISQDHIHVNYQEPDRIMLRMFVVMHSKASDYLIQLLLSLENCILRYRGENIWEADPEWAKRLERNVFRRNSYLQYEYNRLKLTRFN